MKSFFGSGLVMPGSCLRMYPLSNHFAWCVSANFQAQQSRSRATSGMVSSSCTTRIYIRRGGLFGPASGKVSLDVARHADRAVIAGRSGDFMVDASSSSVVLSCCSSAEADSREVGFKSGKADGSPSTNPLFTNLMFALEGIRI